MPRIADYTHMGCRYCGKELALLKRLTGGGEFCSEAHKRSYQEEYNRLALSRLLQAQKVSQGETSSKKAGGASVAPVAVAEPSHEGPRMVDRAVAEPSLEEITPHENTLRDESPDAQPGEMPVMESAPIEISTLDGFGTDETAREDSAAEAALEPSEIAEFLIDGPAMATVPDETPYLESWLELSSGPAVADWQLQDGNGANTLSPAALLSLDLRLSASPAESSVQQPGQEASLTARDFAASEPGRPSLPWKVSAMHQLPYAASVSIEVTITAIDVTPDQSMTSGLDFETTISLQDSPLLVLASTAIEFPAEDSTVELTTQELGASAHSSVSEAGALETQTAAEDASPRASLEALSKLHQDLILQEEAASEEVVASAPWEPVPVAAEVVEAPPAQEPPAETEPSPSETAGAPHGGPASELVDIAVRIFPPARPAPIAGTGLPSQSEPLLPHLKSLPLRPKVAVASGYVPPSATPAHPAKTIASVPKPPSTQATSAPAAPPQAPHKDAAPVPPSKFAPASKPAASRIAQPKQPPAPVKTASTVKTSAPAGKGQPPTQAPTQPAASKTAPPSPAQPETRSAKADAAPPAANPATAPHDSPLGETPAIAASAKTSPPPKPALEEPASTKPEAKPPVKQPLGEPSQESVPNFGAMQQPSSSFAGSLKIKLGIAIVILVVACSTWLGWGGGKSGKPAASGTTTSADGSGPSIIMGEGGWVEGWAGDPSGLHAGRQITIYRPSLKLSDYRIEFEGNIETQSIGWVFRAADPDNYYALKLATVSSGLAPKVALFKYLVINGRQTQVGRVPIDLTVQADTVFNIRTDVRGPQFTTSIQGRQADVWTDDQLKSGGVGFLNERDERGKVKSVSIRYLNGAAK